MEKKRVVPVWVTVVLAVLCCVSVVLYGIQLRNLADAGVLVLLMDVASILAVVFALIYCIGGYKKSGAVFFKLFCCVNVLVILADLLDQLSSFSAGAVNVLMFLFALIELVIFCIFAIEPNMGRKKSFVMVGILLADALLETLIYILAEPMFFINACAGLVVMLVFCIMVYGKYKDKEARGTK